MDGSELSMGNEWNVLFTLVEHKQIGYFIHYDIVKPLQTIILEWAEWSI